MGNHSVDGQITVIGFSFKISSLVSRIYIPSEYPKAQGTNDAENEGSDQIGLRADLPQERPAKSSKRHNHITD